MGRINPGKQVKKRDPKVTGGRLLMEVSEEVSCIKQGHFGKGTHRIRCDIVRKVIAFGRPLGKLRKKESRGRYWQKKCGVCENNLRAESGDELKKKKVKKIWRFLKRPKAWEKKRHPPDKAIQQQQVRIEGVGREEERGGERKKKAILVTY